MNVLQYSSPGLVHRHPGAKVEELGQAPPRRPGDGPGEKIPVLEGHDAKCGADPQQASGLLAISGVGLDAAEQVIVDPGHVGPGDADTGVRHPDRPSLRSVRGYLLRIASEPDGTPSASCPASTGPRYGWRRVRILTEG